MKRLMTKHRNYLMPTLIWLPLVFLNGCAPNATVFYEGTRLQKKTNAAVLTTQTDEDLRNGGYVQIGIIRSVPTTHGLSVSKKEFEQNPQMILDSIAPENDKGLAAYYRSLDKEMCLEAAKVGGEKVRLEEIEHTYPSFADDIACKMHEAMADDLMVKFVTSTKHWSVWRKPD